MSADPSRAAATTAVRGARLQARLSPSQKTRLQRAAELSGRSLSEFVIASAEQAADRLIERHETIRLTRQEQQAFVRALLDDSAVGDRLRRGAAAWRAETGR